MKSSAESNLRLREEYRVSEEKNEIKFMHWLSMALVWGLIVLPLIPASLTFVAIVMHFPALLHIPYEMAVGIAIFASIGIEFLGLGSVKLMLQMLKYVKKTNQDWRKGDTPLWQAVAIVVFYLGIVLSLTVLLKIYPQFAIWSLIPLGIMGFVADWYYGLKQDQDEREIEWEELQKIESEESSKDAEIERLNAELEATRIAAEKSHQETDKILGDVGRKSDELSEVVASLVSEILPELKQEILKEFNTKIEENSERISAEILPDFLAEIELNIERISDRIPTKNPTKIQKTSSGNSATASASDSENRRKKILACYRDGITKPSEMLPMVDELNGNAKTVSSDKKWLINNKYLTKKLNVTKLGNEWLGSLENDEDILQQLTAIELPTLPPSQPSTLHTNGANS